MPLQEHEIPTVILLADEVPKSANISISTVYSSTLEGEEEVFTDFSLYNISNSSLIDSILEFVSSDIYTSFGDIDIEFFKKELQSIDKSTLVAILIALKNWGAINITNVLYFSSYLNTLLNDTTICFRVNLGKVPEEYDTDVEMYIWGTEFFNTKVDVFCTSESPQLSLDADIIQAYGRLVKINSDIYTTNSDLPFINNYICNSALFVENLSTDLNNRSGRIQKVSADVCATNLGLLGGFPAEFKLRSLFTSGFFLETDNFTTASAIAWVDVVDYLYPINVDNTYLSVNDTVVSGIWFEDIPNGKRLYYDPTDDFYSDGVLVYTLHAESSIGEIEEKDFYLLYGYNVEPNEVLDWGPNNRVVVRLEAKNLVFCPNRVGEAFDFTTVDLRSFNLTCSINPVGYVDLPISIKPQSKTFYYGKTYTIRLKNVKDYAGNTMPDLEYQFTIEDPNGV